MTAFTQDTWILNVAKLRSDKDADTYEHFCRIELPAILSKQEAKERADIISAQFFSGFVSTNWKFTLTRWELRGQDISF